jgi:DNA-binding transcriptional MerR regulator
MMDKAPDAYRTISEVAEDLDLPQHVLRFWETRFTQIKPLKRGGGRRYYRPDDVELLKGIRHLLYKEGYTIKGVQRILKEQGARAVQVFALEIAPEPPAPAIMMAPEPLPAPVMPAPVMPAPVMPAPVVPAPVVAAPPPAITAPVMTAPVMTARKVLPAAPTPPNTAPTLPLETPAPVLRPAAERAALPPEADLPNPALENWQPEPEDIVDRPGLAITLEQGPPPPPPPQVSMFRGGLARGEGVVPVPPPSRPAGGERDVPASAGAREAMRYALEELVTCRAIIDRALARRQNA